MDEAEWLACADPRPMLEFLEGEASERKLRLFACACCRRIWCLLTEDDHHAVDVAERYAEGEVTYEDRGAARSAQNTGAPTPWPAPSRAAGTTTMAHGWVAASLTSSHAAGVGLERQAQCDILRDIFGPLPFRSLSPLPASVRTWNGGLIHRLAEAAYENRLLPSGHLDPQRLAVLADALEEFGADAEMLGHLRQPGAAHVRGCHIVDLLLGRE